MARRRKSTTLTKAKAEERFTVGSWAGHPNYECAACPFKTLNRVEIERHWQTRHAPAAPALRPSSLVSATGRPLTLPSGDNEEI